MEFLSIRIEHQPIGHPAPLSPREYSVLFLLAWGYTNKQIAAGLDLSVKTVEAHKANGFKKLDLSGRAALVRYAVDHGWLTND